MDVRIITPGIPDKKLVYSVTRSYYSAPTNHGDEYMNCRAVMDTKYDFENTFAEAKEVTDDYTGAKGMLGLGQQVLRLVAVLL